MKIAVLGASGRTGRLVIDQGIARGHEMTALVRKAAQFAPRDNLSVIEGSPIVAADVERAIADADGVIVTLNNSRTSDLPWARPVSPPNFLESSVRNIAAAMEATESTSRLVMLSAIGVGDSFPDAPWILRQLIRHTNLAIGYADHNEVDAFLRSTALDWTLVRAVGLSNSQKVGQLIVGTARVPKPAMMISRKMVAQFLLHCMESGEHSRSSPVISQG